MKEKADRCLGALEARFDSGSDMGMGPVARNLDLSGLLAQGAWSCHTHSLFLTPRFLQFLFKNALVTRNLLRTPVGLEGHLSRPCLVHDLKLIYPSF